MRHRVFDNHIAHDVGIKQFVSRPRAIRIKTNKYQPQTNTPLLIEARKRAEDGLHGATQAVAQEVQEVSQGIESSNALD